MRAGPDGIPVRDLYLHVFMPVLRETGRLWQTRKISVAQEHYVTGATQMFIALLYPAMLSVSRRGKRRGKTVVAACVSGELHEVGIRMVADFFEMDGWDTDFIGANTPSQSFVATVKDQRADLVAISSTMSFHLLMVHELVMALRSDPETSKTRIVVGGYPFNIMPDLWKRVGADAYAGSADEAVAAG